MRTSSRSGLRVLAAEEDLARELVASLDWRVFEDDFSTGPLSFDHLKRFPVDFLKIDGSFVKGVLHNLIDREMVRSMNEIGHLTGKQTIAEWAENAEIIDVLCGLRADYAHGYGVSQPPRVKRAAIA